MGADSEERDPVLCSAVLSPSCSMVVPYTLCAILCLALTEPPKSVIVNSVSMLFLFVLELLMKISTENQPQNGHEVPAAQRFTSVLYHRLFFFQSPFSRHESQFTLRLRVRC